MKKKGVPHIANISFDHQSIKSDPIRLRKLAEFYCNLWMYDENFGEFKKCVVCEKFYNEEECKTITSCSGILLPHPPTPLVIGWDTEKEIQDILDLTLKYDKKFYGVYALDLDTDKIIGFTWGWLENVETIISEWKSKGRWETEIVDKLGRTDSTYYAEIAIDPTKLPLEQQTEKNKYVYRERKIGNAMCRMLLTWMKENYPNNPSFLRTHKKSPARNMFEKAGYRYFAEDPQHGDGRIMMMVKKGQDLIP